MLVCSLMDHLIIRFVERGCTSCIVSWWRHACMCLHGLHRVHGYNWLQYGTVTGSVLCVWHEPLKYNLLLAIGRAYTFVTLGHSIDVLMHSQSGVPVSRVSGEVCGPADAVKSMQWVDFIIISLKLYITSFVHTKLAWNCLDSYTTLAESASKAPHHLMS